MKIKLVNENKEIKIPSWKRLGVEGEDMCSQYARKLASRLGYNLNIWGETWNLYKNNPWVPFSEDSLKRGYLVTLFNPTSKYNKKGRKETHTAVYLGKDEQGKMYIAEQRGNKTKISTTEEIKKDGMTPVRIIKTEKKSL